MPPDKMNESSFLETVVYTVQSDEDFTSIVSQAEKTLRQKVNGMQWWSHWISTDGKYRADIVSWATPSEAYHAAEVMDKDPDLKFFTSHITEVTHMSHYWLEEHPKQLKALVCFEDQLLELALFTSNNPEVTRGKQRLLHRQIANLDGAIAHYALRDDKNDKAFGDFALWKDADSHDIAGQTLPSDPKLQPYFKSIDSLHIFQLFTLAQPIK